MNQVAPTSLGFLQPDFMGHYLVFDVEKIARGDVGERTKTSACPPTVELLDERLDKKRVRVFNRRTCHLLCEFIFSGAPEAPRRYYRQFFDAMTTETSHGPRTVWEADFASADDLPTSVSGCVWFGTGDGRLKLIEAYQSLRFPPEKWDGRTITSFLKRAGYDPKALLNARQERGLEIRLDGEYFGSLTSEE